MFRDEATGGDDGDTMDVMGSKLPWCEANSAGPLNVDTDALVGEPPRLRRRYRNHANNPIMKTAAAAPTPIPAAAPGESPEGEGDEVSVAEGSDVVVVVGRRELVGDGIVEEGWGVVLLF